MEPAIKVQIQDEAVCISHSANTLENGMNLTILFQLEVNSRSDCVL